MENINKISILSTDDRFKILDLYFKKDSAMFRHHLDSYDIFISKIKDLIVNSNNVIFTRTTATQKITHSLKFTNCTFVSPTNEKKQFITPSIARINNLTYDLTIVVDVEQFQTTYDLRTKKTLSVLIGQKKGFALTKIPLMVKSKYCNLSMNSELMTSECKYDGGGYFILDGTEKIFVPFEELIDNKPLVFKKKESNIEYTIVQLNSKSSNLDEMRQIINIRMKSPDTITLRAPIFRDLSVFVVLRALGIESDKMIIDLITEDENDTEMINLLKVALDNCRNESGEMKIQTQRAAYEFLIKKMKIDSQYTETNAELKKNQRIEHLKTTLKNMFIPHIKKNHYCKALYICLMVKKLLLVFLGRKPYDERDSYENKRIRLPGSIIFEMFRKNYKLMLSDCGKALSKIYDINEKKIESRNSDDKGNNDTLEKRNIIEEIKSSTIESGVKRSMKKDEYSGRSGVCQIVQRGSLLNTIALQTRIDAQIKNKQSSSKILNTRFGHGTQFGFICFAQTPENDKAGLVKNMALLSKITLEPAGQAEKIKELINKKITPLIKSNIQDIKNSVKVFLNGNWLGLIKTENAESFCDTLREKKLKGEIDIHASITYELRTEYEVNEINIWCDEGRPVTLLLRVKDNKVIMTKKKIGEIEKLIDEKSTSTIETFMYSNPGYLEYVSPDELSHSNVAIIPDDVYNEREKQINSIKEISKIKTVINVRQLSNRYSDLSYKKYSYCLIHPSVTFGCVVNNIPFPQCNQSPRVIYGFSQIKQGMTIYSTIYNHRLDITYVLYNPNRPLVNTRTMKYIHTDEVPFGENAIVAVMTYTGYNQDDSLVFNQSSIESGFMRSMSLNKYSSKQEKNQANGKSDIFMKPNRDLTINYKYHFNYNKLNESGYVPAETQLDDGDIIIGKVSPLQEQLDGKTHKDTSTVYKANEKGVVQRIWSDIINQEGYRIIKMLVRSDRKPTVGDKFCSRSGQKGTIGATYRQVDMPFTKDGMYPDILMTPNAFPSRMTISQLHETIAAKYGAAKGCYVDGTAFEKLDTLDLKKKLKELGIKEDGKEKLVNGITGRTLKNEIFIGPTYYLRLKHMVNDKLHARSRGPLTALTRQPLEGRSRDGGLRFGEMERDCMIAHGLSRFFKEKVVDLADKFYIHVCQTCGLFAQRQRVRTSSNSIRNNSNYPSENDVYTCLKCGNRAEIHKTAIPYAFKLLIQEMMALGIESRISFK